MIEITKLTQSGTQLNGRPHYNMQYIESKSYSLFYSHYSSFLLDMSPYSQQFSQQKIVSYMRIALIQPDNLQALFNALKEAWQRDVVHESSISRIVTHPDYQKIIGLGEKVIPLILEDMVAEPNHWFAALRAISRQNPVQKREVGNLKLMINAWLNWGRQYGYIS